MADKIVNLVDKNDNNLYPVAGALFADSVITGVIRDEAVTADKIDWDSIVDFIDVSVNKYQYVDASTATNTLITYSIIPAEYKPKLVMADPVNPNTRRLASEFDYIYKPTLMINAGPWDPDPNNITYGPLVIDHEIKQENNLAGGTDWDRTIVAIDDSGDIFSVNGATAASSVSSYKYTTRAWTTLYNNGVVNPSLATLTAFAPRTFLAQSVDGKYLIGVSGGRATYDTGMNMKNIVDFVTTTLNFNPKVIFNLDGGGSSQLLYRGIRQNQLVENDNRACPNYIVFSSEEARNSGIFEAQSASNLAIVNNSKKSLDYISETYLRNNCHANITVQAPSKGRVMGETLCCLNVNFTIASGVTVPAYATLLDNLPRYIGGALYFTGNLRGGSNSANQLIQLYLNQPSGGTITQIKTRYALTAGTYDMSITYPCAQ